MMERRQIEEVAAAAKEKVKKGISLVWLVPLAALVIGGWVAFKAISEKGPIITITFLAAEGLEAGKTKIKYKEVEIGQVEQITLSNDASHVIVAAKLVKGTEHFLTDKSQFWVVRARVQGGSVSGLGTLLSGAYIGIDPSREGKPTLTYTGLEVPPVVTLGQPGRHFMLKAETLGSLDIGAPVYYRQIQVGQVVSYGYDPGGQGVDIRIFIQAPHHQRITEKTRFWNASGIDVTLNAEGLKVDTQSMVSIATGGIAFDLPKDAAPGEEAKSDTAFHLYADRAGIYEKDYSIRNHWLLMFEQSVRGLTVGAPVELYGIKVGEVIDINLEFDAKTQLFVVPVLVAIEPERIRIVNKSALNSETLATRYGLLKELVEQRGLRAQLQSGNLLTGRLMVNLAFFPESSGMTLVYRDTYPVVPTIPGAFERLQESVVKIIDNLEKVPFNQIGHDIHLLIKDARSKMNQVGDLLNSLDRGMGPLLEEAQKTLQRANSLMGTLDQQTAPQAKATLAELQKTLVELQQTIGEESPLQYDARKTLQELMKTLRGVSQLMDTLSDKPESIIFGKELNSHD